MKTLEDVLWVEKYRPTTLAGVALSENNRAVLQGYLDAEEIPHLLLVGRSGVGKTTVARIMYRALDCRHIVLNASSERGIDVIRNKVASFVTVQSGARYNIVFMDEGDALTSDAQTALRNLIEAYADKARFIFTANNLYRIIAAIQSRCQILEFTTPPLKERYRILQGILQEERIDAEPTVMLSYAERYPDLRQMIMGAQRAFLAKGHLPPVSEDGPLDGAHILELVMTNNWVGIRQLTTGEGFEPFEALRKWFWSIPDDHPKVAFLRHIVGRGVHESGFTTDPAILFIGVCAEVMEGL